NFRIITAHLKGEILVGLFGGLAMQLVVGIVAIGTLETVEVLQEIRRIFDNLPERAAASA
ncbi:hypothetical protein, partial [Escherichia coli]|uniref:hypothetical protein n=1 Tax=Escherichia coli TaxID=562 RepID=UPI0019819125|nr:hypothetical protein [Escherichia coli]